MVKKKKSRKHRIVPLNAIDAMDRRKKQLEYVDFHNTAMEAQRRRAMSRYVHGVMYDRLTPSARDGAYNRLNPEILSQIFPDL